MQARERRAQYFLVQMLSHKLYRQVILKGHQHQLLRKSKTIVIINKLSIRKKKLTLWEREVASF